jgi:glycosyltransferase 2 family protein
VRPLIRAAVGLGLAALVVFVVGPAALLERLQGVRIEWFAAAFAIATTANVFSALRWAAIARALGLGARSGELLVFYFRGVTTNSILPGALLGGDLLRAVQLSRCGNSLVDSMSSLVIDRLSGLWVQAAVSLVAFGALAIAGDSPLPPALSIGYFGLLLAILAAPALPLGFLAKSRYHFIARAGEAFARWQRFAKEQPAAFARLAALAGVVALGSSTALWLCLRAIGADPSFAATLALACGVFVGAALPLAWAGFGPREVAAVVLLSLLAPGAAGAAAASVLYGLASTLQGILAAPLLAVELKGERGAGKEARRER